MTTQHPVRTPKKLIEVALPLDAINEEAARRKRKAPAGYPTTLHKWWAQRPVAAARAVIFGQLVNDPSWQWEFAHHGEIPPNNLKASWAASRKRLFGIIEDLVKWENTTNEQVLERARAEIRRSWRETCELNKDHPQAAELFNPDKLPAFHDPFAGAGTLPMEAQRLGLRVVASDLNPVAVAINRATIAIPPRFAGLPPVNPSVGSSTDLIERRWSRAEGLAEDVRYYSLWLRDQAKHRIGHLYPPVAITADMAKDRPDLKPLVGQTLPVVAWLWARTVKSPNPAFRHIAVPLASTFVLARKEQHDVFVRPVLERDSYSFSIEVGKAPADARAGTKLARGANFKCIMSEVPIHEDYIKGESAHGRMGVRLMAMVVDGPRGRLYLPPTTDQENAASRATPEWRPEQRMNQDCSDLVSGRGYGIGTWAELFTARQLVALNTLTELLDAVQERVRDDAAASGLSPDTTTLASGGTGAYAYAEAVRVYLSFAISRVADYGSAFATWRPKDSAMRSTLASQAIPMAYDFAEGAPFAKSSAGFGESAIVVARALEYLPASADGEALLSAAQDQSISQGCAVSTDPPYYNNIAYADLSDFLYIWLRRSLKAIWPDIFSTLEVPKLEELVASPHRHGGTKSAEAFFLDGMTKAMRRLAGQAHPAVPLTIYYAHKQAETDTGAGTSSTGWETFLEAVSRAGLALTGTWPMRTEGDNRQVGIGANALASSIILVCRPRSDTARTTSRRAFVRELNRVLPEALDEMTRGSGGDQSPVLPVDLSQAIIGPGMAVFSQYAAVLEADGEPMSVKTALQLINRFLAEDDFDNDTQFCLHWFEQHGWKDGKFGEGDTLARAKGTSVDGVKQAGVIAASAGVVRLLKWSDYPTDWDPLTDPRLPVWEALHQLIRIFKAEGEVGAGAVLAIVQDKSESMRQLGYRLHTLCERAGWAEDARAYNEIITSWSAIEAAAAAAPTPQQTTLFG